MRIQNSFLRKTSIYFIGTLSTKMISVILVPIYAYFVSVDALSEYDYTVTIASTFVPIVYGAIWESVLKFCIKKNEDVQAVFSTVLSFSLFMSFLCLILCFGMHQILSESINFVYLSLFIVVQGITTIWQFSARALHENKSYVVSAVLGSITLIVTDVILILLKKLEFEGLCISYVFSQCIIIITLERKIRLFRYFRVKIVSKSMLTKLLAFSLPLVINNVSLWLYSSGSRVIIKNSIGVTENGLYAFASKFSLLISLLSSVMSMAVIEEAYSYNTIKEYKEKVSGLIATISKAYFSLICLALPAIYILYCVAFKHTEYYNSVDYIFLLLLAALFTALSNNYGSSFQVTDNTKYVFLTTVAGAAVAIGSSILLSRFWGVYGVLIGGALGPFCMMVLRAIYAKRTTGLTIKWLTNVRIFVVSLIAYCILLKYEYLLIQVFVFVVLAIYLIWEYKLEIEAFKKKIFSERI